MQMYPPTPKRQHCIACDWKGSPPELSYKDGRPHTRSALVGYSQSINPFVVRIPETVSNRPYDWVYCTNCTAGEIKAYADSHGTFRDTVGGLCKPECEFVFRRCINPINTLIMHALCKAAHVDSDPSDLILDYVSFEFFSTARYIAECFAGGTAPSASDVYSLLRTDLDQLLLRLTNSPDSIEIGRRFKGVFQKGFPDFISTPLRHRLRSSRPLVF